MTDNWGHKYVVYIYKKGQPDEFMTKTLVDLFKNLRVEFVGMEVRLVKDKPQDQDGS